MQILPKPVSESLFWLLKFAGSALAGFRQLHVYGELCFIKPLYKATGWFQLAEHNCENTFCLISSLLKAFSHS
jgi:hypothetical protein